jgi:hypothetical protein
MLCVDLDAAVGNEAVDVLHMGILNPRRQGVLDAILAKAPLGTRVGTLCHAPADSDKLARLVRAARVVVAPHFYAAAPMGCLHRVGVWMRARGEHTRLVTEACPDSDILRQLFPLWGVDVVPYEALAQTVVDLLQAEPRTPAKVTDRSFVDRVMAWDGRTPLLPLACVPRVCLVMIVRDEERVLQRCLDSVWPLVDAYCILDTGSVDGTQAVLEAVVRRSPKPGAFVRGQWRGYAASRTEALALARVTAPECSWHLMMDADDTLHAPLGSFLRVVEGVGAYTVKVAFNTAEGIQTFRHQLFASAMPWAYTGVVHEHPTLPAALVPTCTEAALPATTYIIGRTEGYRSRNPRKYADDAAVLAAHLETHPEDHRARFYLGQSLRDAGDGPGAVTAYTAFVTAGKGWTEERYMACMYLVDSTPDDLVPFDAKVKWAWEAAALSPTRLEVALCILFGARRRGAESMTRQVYALGLLAWTHGASTCEPGFVFGVPETYAWRFADELSVHASFHGFREFAHSLMARVLACPTLPDAERARVQGNYTMGRPA